MQNLCLDPEFGRDPVFIGYKTYKSMTCRFLLLMPDSVQTFQRERGIRTPEPLSSTVFKTAAIDHSAISPNDASIAAFQKSSAKVELF